MKKSKEQDLENYVIKSLNDFKPEEYYDFLWKSRLIGSQGPWTLDYLSDSGTISYEAQSFVQSHLDNERESDVCEAAQELYLDVIMMRAAESVREAKSGNDDYSWLLDIEDEDERFNEATDDAADDLNYPALQSVIAWYADLYLDTIA